jgi:hypothetical protein
VVEVVEVLQQVLILQIQPLPEVEEQEELQLHFLILLYLVQMHYIL